MKNLHSHVNNVTAMYQTQRYNQVLWEMSRTCALIFALILWHSSMTGLHYGCVSPGI